MKCLTVMQPWAWAILHSGKSDENRKWMTAHHGPLLIHAGKSQVGVELEYGLNRTNWPGRYGVDVPSREELVCGAVLGVAKVMAVTDGRKGGELPSCWAGPGLVWWELADPVAFPEPVPLRGRMALFDVDHSRVLEQLGCVGWAV